ncbi:asparagine synthase-related protein [Pseudidiomarina sp. PP-1MA]|uniref:asparagine synthase (glutamine-hydrolyzing) n=1 Tax=Pseudidiomarina sp. PP-1MA TaxID=3237706 RepID=A0AB39XA09_9GAMM
MQKMIAASDYWNPEQCAMEKAERSQSDLLVSHLLFNNTPQSLFETVHKSPCGNYFCVANARLDNRDELLHELAISSADDLADGALILTAYQHWGEGCSAKLLGDFVFTIWDGPNQLIYIGRDHIGIKTVFYSVTDSVVLVSNEHNALLSSGLVPRALSHDFVVDQFLPRSQSGYYSPIEAIKRVEPAHYVVIDAEGVRQQRYWQLEVKHYAGLTTDEDYLRELRAQFERAVQRRLVTQHPIGCELSEGLDSTAITGLTAKLLPEQTIYTYSYDSQQLTDDNRHIYAATYKDIFDFLALHTNLEAQWSTHPPPENYQEIATGFYGILPPNPGQQVTRYYLMQEKGVRTLLSGWGGDHCVTSYGSFYEDELFKRGRWVKLYKQLHDMRSRGRGTRPLASFLKLSVKYLCPPLFRVIERRRNALVRLLTFAAENAPLRNGLVSPERLKKSRDYADSYTCRGVRERDYRELFYVGTESRVTGSEVHARAFNFEYRYPMFDKELIEFAYSVPNHLKCKFGIERWMFREIIKDLVTERIRMRMKSDVDLPKYDRLDLSARFKKTIDEVLQRKHEPLLREYIESERLEELTKITFVGNLRALDTLLQLSTSEQLGHIQFEKRNTNNSV